MTDVHVGGLGGTHTQTSLHAVFSNKCSPPIQVAKFYPGYDRCPISICLVLKARQWLMCAGSYTCPNISLCCVLQLVLPTQVAEYERGSIFPRRSLV